jgi:hypothetical protein
MTRRPLKAALAALLALLAVLVPLTLPTPAAAVPLPMELDLVTGQLNIRDSEEPAGLEVPTTFDATVDNANGQVTAGTFSAAPLEFQFDITEPVVATVFVDAEFNQITPGSATGAIQKVSNTEANVSANVDVRVDLHIEVGDPSFLTADCVANPVSLRLTSTAPYDYGTELVSLEDEDFSVPAVPVTAECPSIIADGVNERLAGGGHSIDMNMTGEIPEILIGVCPNTTDLTVEPASSRQGDEVILSAKVTPVVDEACNPAPMDPVTGIVQFRDGTTVLAEVPVDGDGEATFATTSLPEGHRSLTALYAGDLTYEPSTSDVKAHLVAAAPTVTLPDPIQPIVIEGNARPVTIALTNPADIGATIDGARLDVSIARVGSLTSVFTPDRLTLEYFDGSTWTPVTLTETSPRVLSGSVSGLTLDPGETLNVPLRYKAFAIGTTVSTTACGGSNPTCPGPLTLTAKLVSGDGLRTFATDEGPVDLVQTSRRPSTAAFAGGTPRNHTLRQGYSVLATTLLTPTFGGVPWSGLVEAYLDGVQVPMRDTSTPFETGYTNQFNVRSSSVSPWILLPADIDTGSHQLTVRYLGDPYHGPAEVTGSFTILAAAGHPFVCRETTLTSNIEWGANVVFDADLPASALPGTEIEFSADDARLLMHRQTIAGPLLFADNNATTPVGANGLEAITFDLGDQGSASGTEVARTGGTILPASPNPAPESAVDQTYDVGGVTGTATIAGEPGDDVKVELDEVVFSYRDTLFGFPLEARCTARGGPMEIGEIEVAGTTLTATPNPAREITDEVDLAATTFPSDAAGTVSFSSDLDGALGDVAVVGGAATLTTDELSDGTHQITASFNATDSEVPDSQVTETIRIQYSPRTGTEAFVVAALTDFTGAADKDDVLAGAALLDGGQKKSTYLTTLSRSDEYLTHVVQQMYLDTLDREGDETGVAYWVDKLRTGTPVHVVAASFYGSPEYYARVGGTDQEWVEDLYLTLLGREGEPDGIAYWITQIPLITKGGVAKVFYQTPESRAFRVADLYDFFLDREPSEDEIDYWSQILKARGDIVLAVFLASSDEYADIAEDRFPIVV